MVLGVPGCQACKRATSGVCQDHRKTTCRHCGVAHTPRAPGNKTCWLCQKRINRGQLPLTHEQRNQLNTRRQEGCA